jgi:hypothetical protein
MANKNPPVDVEALIAKARKPKADDGQPVDGELKAIMCYSPLHDSRRGLKDEHDHRDYVGTYTGVVPPQIRCNRCHHHDGIAAARAQADAADARRALLQRLGLSETDIGLLLS